MEVTTATETQGGRGVQKGGEGIERESQYDTGTLGRVERMATRYRQTIDEGLTKKVDRVADKVDVFADRMTEKVSRKYQQYNTKWNNTVGHKMNEIEEKLRNVPTCAWCCLKCCDDPEAEELGEGEEALKCCSLRGLLDFLYLMTFFMGSAMAATISLTYFEPKVNTRSPEQPYAKSFLAGDYCNDYDTIAGRVALDELRAGLSFYNDAHAKKLFDDGAGPRCTDSLANYGLLGLSDFETLKNELTAMNGTVADPFIFGGSIELITRHGGDPIIMLAAAGDAEALAILQADPERTKTLWNGAGVTIEENDDDMEYGFPNSKDPEENWEWCMDVHRNNRTHCDHYLIEGEKSDFDPCEFMHEYGLRRRMGSLITPSQHVQIYRRRMGKGPTRLARRRMDDGPDMHDDMHGDMPPDMDMEDMEDMMEMMIAAELLMMVNSKEIEELCKDYSFVNPYLDGYDTYDDRFNDIDFGTPSPYDGSEPEDWCKRDWVGDGVCDPPCNTAKYLFDDGDCEGYEEEECDQYWLGDGICDMACNKPEYHYDHGDCEHECEGDDCHEQEYECQAWCTDFSSTPQMACGEWEWECGGCDMCGPICTEAMTKSGIEQIASDLADVGGYDDLLADMDTLLNCDPERDSACGTNMCQFVNAALQHVDTGADIYQCSIEPGVPEATLEVMIKYEDSNCRGVEPEFDPFAGQFDPYQYQVTCGHGGTDSGCRHCTSSEPDRCNSADCTWDGSICKESSGDGPHGEAACENHGFDEAACMDVGCCHWNSQYGQCFSDVGKNPCYGGSSGGGSSGGSSSSHSGGSGGGQNGEEACEGHGYDRNQCDAVGCCEYHGGECYSDVGQGACHNDRRLEFELRMNTNWPEQGKRRRRSESSSPANPTAHCAALGTTETCNADRSCAYDTRTSSCIIVKQYCQKFGAESYCIADGKCSWTPPAPAPGSDRRRIFGRGGSGGSSSSRSNSCGPKKAQKPKTCDQYTTLETCDADTKCRYKLDENQCDVKPVVRQPKSSVKQLPSLDDEYCMRKTKTIGQVQRLGEFSNSFNVTAEDLNVMYKLGCVKDWAQNDSDLKRQSVFEMYILSLLFYVFLVFDMNQFIQKWFWAMVFRITFSLTYIYEFSLFVGYWQEGQKDEEWFGIVTWPFVDFSTATKSDSYIANFLKSVITTRAVSVLVIVASVLFGKTKGSSIKAAENMNARQGFNLIYFCLVLGLSTICAVMSLFAYEADPETDSIAAGNFIGGTCGDGVMGKHYHELYPEGWQTSADTDWKMLNCINVKISDNFQQNIRMYVVAYTSTLLFYVYLLHNVRNEFNKRLAWVVFRIVFICAYLTEFLYWQEFHDSYKAIKMEYKTTQQIHPEAEIITRLTHQVFQCRIAVVCVLVVIQILEDILCKRISDRLCCEGKHTDEDDTLKLTTCDVELTKRDPGSPGITKGGEKPLDVHEALREVSTQI